MVKGDVKTLAVEGLVGILRLAEKVRLK